MSYSDIEWTDRTWNPTKGCSKVSDGCKNCYAIRMAARLEAMKSPYYIGLTKKTGGKLNWTGQISIDENAIKAPLKWSKPSKIFVNSMSDLFHENIPFSIIKKIWAVMEKADHHQFQILTKRPENMLKFFNSNPKIKIMSHVWLGVSIENSSQFERLNILRRIPAPIRFVSFEPLLGSVKGCSLNDIHWAIVGGESGPKSRPIKEEWVSEIQDLCKNSKTSFFFKQWGGTNKKKSGRLINGETFNNFPQQFAERHV